MLKDGIEKKIKLKKTLKAKQIAVEKKIKSKIDAIQTDGTPLIFGRIGMKLQTMREKKREENNSLEPHRQSSTDTRLTPRKAWCVASNAIVEVSVWQLEDVARAA